MALGEIDRAPGWEATAWLVVLALTSQVVGWLLISFSLPRVPAAVTSVVLTLQPVMSVLLAMLLLDEDPSAVQIAGVSVVPGGIALATMGRPRLGRERPSQVAPVDLT
jgi:drug/metabolite transporter (DMT)-like permease